MTSLCGSASMLNIDAGEIQTSWKSELESAKELNTESSYIS